jgi:hypothetical protein
MQDLCREEKHNWELDGQTMTAYRWFCTKCGLTRESSELPPFKTDSVCGDRYDYQRN